VIGYVPIFEDVVALVLSAGEPVIAEDAESPFTKPVVENVKAGTVPPTVMDRLLAVTVRGALAIEREPPPKRKL
jgi:hypothetical protein